MSDFYKESAKFKRLRENLFYPKGLFLGCALTGAVSIWIIKTLSSSTLSYAIAVLLAVGLMFLYCGLSSHVKAFSLREDVIGDNVYYLGFLFTLASLAHALWVFQPIGTSTTGGATQHIIQSFGIALWSTIVGIILRVYYAQHRQDPDEFERDARSKLAQTATELNVQLNSCIFEFSKFRTSLQQSVQEAFDQSSQTYSEALANNLQKLTSATEESLKKIEAAFALFTDHSKGINEVAGKTVKSLSSYNDKLEKAEPPDAAINKKYEKFVTALEGSGERFSQLVEGQLTAANDLVAQTESITKKLEGVSNSIVAIHQNSSQLAGSTRNFDSLTASLDELVKSFAGLKQGLSELVSSQSSMARSATTHSNELAAQLDRARQYTQQVHDNLVSMTRSISDNLR